MAYVKIGELPIGATHPSLGANQSADGIVTYGTLGENCSFGDLLCQNSEGKYYKALADSDEKMPVVAMAVWTEASGKVCPILKQGYVRNDSWAFINGKKLYIDASTTGRITTKTPTDYRQIVGSVEKSNIIYFNPEGNYHYGSSERTTIKDLDSDVKALFEKQQIPYIVKIWEEDAGIPKPIIKSGKHVRLNVLDASIVVGDNSNQEQSVEIIGITSRYNIATTYGAGVSIPLKDYIIRKIIGLNEQIEVIASGGRRVTVELLCESGE